MKILHVNPVLNVKKGGGTADRNVKMIKYLKKLGVSNFVLTMKLGAEFELANYSDAEGVLKIGCIFRRFFVPAPEFKKIWEFVSQVDLVHLMSHWTFLNAYVFIICKLQKKPYVICPAGALPIFGRSKLFKLLYRIIVGNKILKDASTIIAITQAEADYVEKQGLDKNKIAVIPNGVEFNSVQTDQNEIRRQLGVFESPYILFVGRLNLIKGIDMLVESFIAIADKIPNVHLVIAGGDEGLGPILKEKTTQAGLNDRIHFVGFLNQLERQLAYKEAEFLVIPSRSEAMSIVVLEAGIEGTPSVFTDQCGLDFLAVENLSLQVKAEVTSISEGILQMLQNENTEEMGQNLQKYVREKFIWDEIILKYKVLFQNIILKRQF